MPGQVRFSNVGIFTRNQKKAKGFYVRKVGLKVRQHIPKMGYLELGASVGGGDASLNIWQPTRETWGEDYRAALKQVGQATGIGFRTADLDKTLAMMKRRGVKVDWVEEEPGGRMASILDPEHNSIFVYESAKSRTHGAGLDKLDFVTIVTRDANRAGIFFSRVLGMKRLKTFGLGMLDYRLSPKGTALVPFKPMRDLYDRVSDYRDDLAHIGEDTSIMFETSDVYSFQERLLKKGVRFKAKAKPASWGGIEAYFYDPDKNLYMVYQPVTLPRRKK